MIPDPDRELAFSSRCQSLSACLQNFMGGGRKSVLAPYFPDCSAATLARYTGEKNKRLKPNFARSLGNAVHDHCGFDPDEVAAHLLDGSLRSNRTLVDMIHSHFVRDNVDNLPLLTAKLDKYFNDDARLILSLQRRLPFRHMTDDYIDAWAGFEQMVHGFDDATKAAKIKLAQRCQRTFLTSYRENKTRTVLGLIESGLTVLKSPSQHAMHLESSVLADVATSLRIDLIRDRAFDIRIVADDSKIIQPQIASWVAPIELVVAVDGRFLMKVLSNGSRAFYERGDDSQKNQQLDEQLLLLKQTLGFRDSAEKPANALAIQWLDSLTRDTERRLKKYRRRVRSEIEKRCQQEGRIVEEPPKGFYTPNGLFIPFRD